MLLTLLGRLRREDRGQGFVATVAVMMLTGVVAVAVTGATINALGASTATRAQVQARAAAEAGIAVALASLQTPNDCGAEAATYVSAAGATPEYSARVESYSSAAAGGWTHACPGNATPRIRILSTGTASDPSTGGRDEVALEAVYEWEPIVIQVPLAGSAIAADKLSGTLKKFTLMTEANSVATSVTIREGDVECTNGASIGGDLILGSGDAVLNRCDVAGSLHIGGDMAISRSDIGGDVRAAATANADGDITISNSTVGGRGYASGVINASNTTFEDGPPVSGTSVSPPAIPGWVDVPGDHGFWQDRGYDISVWGGPCWIDKHTAEWNLFGSYTSPRVIDFRSTCPGGIRTASNIGRVSLQTSLVLLGTGFEFGKLYFTTPDSTLRTLTFVVPDGVDDGEPTCTPPSPSALTFPGGIYLNNEADLEDTIAAMLYTPCKIYSDRNGFRGQMYSGEVEFGQQASLTFVPVGIEGVDLTDGATTPVVSGSHLGALEYLRDVDD